MGQVSVTLNGRAYRLRCEDGEEDRLLALGNHVRDHIDRLTREFGQVGDDRLLAMTAILIADELMEARERLAETEGAGTRRAKADLVTGDNDGSTAGAG